MEAGGFKNTEFSIINYQFSIIVIFYFKISQKVIKMTNFKAIISQKHLKQAYLLALVAIDFFL